MNNDLISREALKEEVSKLILNWNDKTEYGQARISSYEFVLELINNAPTVEYERPQGEWIYDENFINHFRCNLCNDHNDDKTNFCPNCGAKMKGGAE